MNVENEDITAAAADDCVSPWQLGAMRGSRLGREETYGESENEGPQREHSGEEKAEDEIMKSLRGTDGENDSSLQSLRAGEVWRNFLRDRKDQRKVKTATEQW